MVGLRVRGWSLRRWAIIVGAWSAVGAFGVTNAFCNSLLNGTAFGWRHAVVWMTNMWLWALLTPSLLWWARKLAIERGSWHWRLAVHAGLSLAYAAVSTAWDQRVGVAIDDPRQIGLGAAYFGELFYNVVSYGAVVVIAHTLAYARQLTDRRMRAVELEHELTRAQLAALEMQLRPHFLFNTLHGVAGLIRSGDPDGAIQMIGGLGDLLRTVLDEDRAQELPLAEELQLAELYLEIERIRFADRLRVAFDIAPAARAALVPRLLLQPLLENSIRHGVQTHEQGGAVIVRAACGAQALVLEVIDSGGPDHPGPTGHGIGHGIGLANTRDRLRHLYGSAQRLELEPQATGGTIVRISLPLRHAPGAAP